MVGSSFCGCYIIISIIIRLKISMWYLVKLCVSFGSMVSRIVVRIMFSCEFMLFSMMMVRIRVDLMKVKDFGVIRFWWVVKKELVRLVKVVLSVKVESFMWVGLMFSEW